MNTAIGIITVITKRPLLENADMDAIMTVGEGNAIIPKKYPVKGGKNLMVCIMHFFNAKVISVTDFEHYFF